MTTLHTGTAHSLPGPENISRTVLPNGITVLLRTNLLTPSVVISGYIPAGSLFDPGEYLGLAHFTAAALMRGTHSRSFRQIFDDLETAAASLGFGASVHNTSFGGRCLTEDLPMAMRLLADCLRHPVFPVEQVDRLRAQALTGLAIRSQDTTEMASLTFDELLFPGYPYGLPEDGRQETVARIQADDLAKFHRTHYGPRGMVLVAVGAITSDQFLDLTQQVLGDWQNPEQAEEPTIPASIQPAAAIRKHVSIPGKVQTDLVMGTLGPKRKDPDYFAASLGNNILGQFGMMGRIGDSVREKSGLAYYASTSLNAWISAGSWEISAGINPANLERAIDLILDEVQRFTRDGVTAEELQDSKSNTIGRLPISLESNSGIARSILNIERFQLGLDYYQKYNDLIESVTGEQVVETARRHLDIDRFITVSAGSNYNEAA